MADTTRNRHGDTTLLANGRAAGTPQKRMPPALRRLGLSFSSGDVLIFGSSLYITHSGLLKIAFRHRCFGIHVRPVAPFCDPAEARWAFKATVYKSPQCRGFIGYGDADPSNVSAQVRGAEMRVAETRAVNRALRKAYGIGLCSVEEVGTFPAPPEEPAPARQVPVSMPINRNGGHPLRDRLCLLIRKHGLNGNLVKLYAADFCGTQELRQASREQVADFITHLAQYAEHDRDGLLCRLNSYGPKPPAPTLPDANEDHENLRGAA